MPRNTPLSGQFPPDKESASEGPEARRGVRPEVCTLLWKSDVRRVYQPIYEQKSSEFFLKKDIYAAEDMGGKNSDGVPISQQSAVHGEISDKLTYVSSNSSPP